MHPARRAASPRERQSSFGATQQDIRYHISSTVRASSDMRLVSQGGSQTILTLDLRTPDTPATAFSTSPGNSAADGQFGDVSVISIVTMRSSSISTL